MCKSKYAVVCLAFIFAMNILATVSFAGLVTTGIYNGWSGTSEFFIVNETNPGHDLIGHVDWAVYAPGAFPYVLDTLEPTDPAIPIPANEYAYVYQVFGTGSDAIHSFSLEVGTVADTIGTFSNLEPSIATASYLDPDDGTANWYFSPGISGPTSVTHPDPDHSRGLVFFSPMAPYHCSSIIQDGGLVANPWAACPVPEPSTLILWVIGMGIALVVARFRRR